MISSKKSVLTSIVLLLFFVTCIYFEHNGFEWPRILVVMLGVFEFILLSFLMTRFENYSKRIGMTSPKNKLITLIICVAFIAGIIFIDNLVNSLSVKFNFDYSKNWTVWLPIITVLYLILKSLDLWAFDREPKRN